VSTSASSESTGSSVSRTVVPLAARGPGEEADMLKVIDENKVWTLEIAIGENSDETEAQARLRVEDTETVGFGRARRHPHDPARPRVGEELAVARALADLSHRLIDAAIVDIEEFEGRPVHLQG
jgi:hypothetical protein